MQTQRHILYAEDDETLAFLTREGLQQHGFTVDHFSNGQDCLQAFAKGKYSCCILDIMLPGADGFAIAAAIRARDPDVPVIFLSAKTLQEDRLKGLRTGADDYLVKPFSLEELVLKMEIFLSRPRKSAAAPAGSYHAGAYRFDPANFSLQKEGEEIILTQKEAELLRLLLDHANQVLKREQILSAIWGQEGYFYGRSLDVFISRLRKIFAGEQGVRIETMHGIGFRWVDKTAIDQG